MNPEAVLCSICSQLKDRETAFQKYGSSYPDTYLPAAAEQLEIVIDFRPLSERKIQLRRCPECGRYYLYQTDYEYLTNGTEDEQELIRLSDAEAEEYIKAHIK
jgi:hypothetical protein